ncbi:MAG: hypothetical protein QGH51_01745 [Planctomycetota bacterium]|jgi:hypothetical protein|nr:hypothetical protein [Planctomycetota bacterium]MDP6940723.1 hypothetical protein [Planctomycetota bacterium]
MKFSPLARISAVICLLMLVSGWLPIPLPTSLLKHAQDFLPEGSAISAKSLRLRWACGEFSLADLRLEKSEDEVFQIKKTRLHLDLVPWSPHFLETRSLSLSDGNTNLDHLQPVLSSLLEGSGSSQESPPVQVRIQNLSATMGLASGIFHFGIEDVLGHSTSLGTQLYGELSTPYGFNAEAWLELGIENQWSLDIHSPQTTLAHLDFLPVTVSADSCELRAHLDQTNVQVDFQLTGASLQMTDPPLDFELDKIRIFGPLSSGIQMTASGRLEGSPLRAEAWVKRDHANQWAARLEGEARAIVLDEDRVAWLQQLDPGTAEVFEALELDGATSANFSWDWNGDDNGKWLVHAPFQNLGITYRGFLEQDGDRPSFPYPVKKMAGDFLAASRRLVFNTTGDMGTAPVIAEGTVLITDGPAQIGIDLDVTGLEMDGRITSALSGTPEASAIWRDLGGPSGGEADLKLRLRRTKEDSHVRVDLEGEVRGTELRPSFLPIPIELNGAWIHWAPGSAEFAGPVRALGGNLLVKGEARSVLNGNLPAIQMRAVTEEGIDPVLEDRKILEGFLGLPGGISGFTLEGPAKFELGVRRPGSDSRAQVLIENESKGLNLRWDNPNTNWENLVGKIAIAVDGKQILFSAPDVVAQCCNGELSASASLLHFDDQKHGRGTIVANNLEVRDETVRFARALAGLKPEMVQPIEWSGQVHLVAELDLLEPGKNRGQIHLSPLEVRQGFLLPSEGTSLRGRFGLRDTALVEGQLQLTGSAGNMELHDVFLETMGDGFYLEANLDSKDGIEISDRFSALLSPGAWNAFQRIGLRGRVGADAVRIRLNSNPGESSFELEGNLLLREMGVDAAPVLENGSASLQVIHFQWNNPTDFGGSFQLQNAKCDVAGFSFIDANGNLTLAPDELRFNSFEGELLGGVVGTESPDSPGHLRLGLEDQAPISFLLYLDSLSLARLREELNLGGDLAGKVSGKLNFESATPNPLDYKGVATLAVEGGVLGAVPVLSRMWAVAGVKPPIFKSGHFTLRANPTTHRGRIRLEKFDLEHELLQVQGRGWVGLDSYLNLKATVRSGIVPILGWGIPLISDLFFDPLVEQDIVGPLESPLVTQRFARRLDKEKKLESIPFPLWIPEFDREDWWKSPALPASRD